MLQNERVLFHYNGHGVPRPTANGEIWVFNKSYTQYIPLSMYDLQAWVGSPCIYVFDCAAAGIIVNSFRQFAEQRALVWSLYPAFVLRLLLCMPLGCRPFMGQALQAVHQIHLGHCERCPFRRWSR